MQKQKNKTLFPLVCLITKIEHYTVFILQNKILKNILIYYYYCILEISIMF